MTGPVQTSLEKTGPRPPVLSECQSDSSGGNMHELATAGRARTVFRTPCFYIHLHIHVCFLGPTSCCLFVCPSYSEEVSLHHNCAFFETSGQSEKWEGCAHVIRITTPSAACVADGRPKSAPIAHWSRWFMCSPFC